MLPYLVRSDDTELSYGGRMPLGSDKFKLRMRLIAIRTQKRPHNREYLP